MNAGSEYRVRWRRVAWSERTATKSRIFARGRDALAFVAKLRDTGRPDLSDVVDLQLDRRDVGDWQEVTR